MSSARIAELIVEIAQIAASPTPDLRRTRALCEELTSFSEQDVAAAGDGVHVALLALVAADPDVTERIEANIAALKQAITLANAAEAGEPT